MTEINDHDRELTTYSYISNHLCFEYFVGYELLALLGYKNASRTIKDNVSKCNQITFNDYPGVKEPEQAPQTILITRDGVVELLLKTRKRISPDVAYLLKQFHIDTTNRKCLTKEQQTLSAIVNAFKLEKYEDQYKVDTYYLDLYFTEHKIVVECDENGHADRKPADERERMDYVNTKFDIDDSHWIRYNPDEHDFDISKVIGKIYLLMEGIKHKKYTKLLVEVEELKTKSLVDIKYLKVKNPYKLSQKPCNVCKIIKSLDSFYDAKDHIDGKENTCKPCVTIRQKKYVEEKKKTTSLPTEKLCTSCKTLLPLSGFYKDTHKFDGVGTKCKECVKLVQSDTNKIKIIVTEYNCNTCKITKPITEFGVLTRSTTGHKYTCKSCVAAAAKVRYQKNLNRAIDVK